MPKQFQSICILSSKDPLQTHPKNEFKHVLKIMRKLHNMHQDVHYIQVYWHTKIGFTTNPWKKSYLGLNTKTIPFGTTFIPKFQLIAKKTQNRD